MPTMTKIVIAVAFVLSACATTEAPQTATSSTERGTAPALVELMIGSLRGQRGSNAAIGDFLESVRTGVPYDTFLEVKARRYATSEARAAAMARSADATLAHFNRLNGQARTMLVEHRAEIARLNDAYRARTISKEQFQEQLARSNRNRDALKEQVAALEAEIKARKSDPPAEEMSKQIRRLEQQRDALKATYDNLLQLYGTVPAEVRG